ncbi:hypothetical protein [Acuticoccus sediminis]|uniref:hypothetical protein n=1 Tax=Acuticoccus sediminis TaxID=2184697 RepID=UPI001CFE8D4D|nr:hypothetical protein [Acuticoccus sediminis]
MLVDAGWAGGEASRLGESGGFIPRRVAAVMDSWSEETLLAAVIIPECRTVWLTRLGINLVLARLALDEERVEAINLILDELEHAAPPIG